MDRQLRVSNDGKLFAEMEFNYYDQTSGKVSVTIYTNNNVDGTDIYVPIPLLRVKEEFHHDEMNTMEVVKNYDIAELKKISDAHGDPFPENLAADYLAYWECRYRVGNCAIGIVNMSVNFIEKTKSLQFISCHTKGADKTAATEGWDSNMSFIRKSLSLEPEVEIILVD